MAAIDDLTELVERAAAAEKSALASKWKDEPDVQSLIRRSRAAAEEQRQAVLPQLAHHRRPGLVEVVGGRGRAASGDPVGLGHQRDPDSRGDGGVVHRHQVGRVNVTARAVTENQQADGRPGGVRDPDPRRPARRVEREAAHSSMSSGLSAPM